MKTFATLFSGGEIAGVGMRDAGLEHLWGVEYDAKIADVARQNGFNILTEDVRNVDFSLLLKPGSKVDWLHASPPCIRASEICTVKCDEAQLDIDFAESIIRAARVLQPEMLSIENVKLYRRFKSFSVLIQALEELYKHVEVHLLTMGDYGVPQKRRRLFILASDRTINIPEKSKKLYVNDVVDFGLFTRYEHKSKIFAEVLELIPYHVRTYLNPAVLFYNRRTGYFRSYTTYVAVTSDSIYCCYNGVIYDIGLRNKARLQTLPDSYVLNTRTVLGNRIIGNGVPCLFMKKLVECNK